MYKNQENKFSMYRTVQNTLQNNTSLWETIPAYAKEVTAFNDIVNQLAEQLNVQRMKISGATQAKYSRRNELIDLVISIAGALHSYAKRTNDKRLQSTTDIERSDLTDSRDSYMIEASQGVANAAQKHTSALQDYNITQEMITQLQSMIDEFRPLSVAPRDAIVIRSAATKRIAVLIKEADETLNSSLDKLMETFKNTHPQFYTEYFAGRIIADVGIRHKE